MRISKEIMNRRVGFLTKCFECPNPYTIVDANVLLSEQPEFGLGRKMGNKQIYAIRDACRERYVASQPEDSAPQESVVVAPVVEPAPVADSSESTESLEEGGLLAATA